MADTDTLPGLGDNSRETPEAQKMREDLLEKYRYLWDRTKDLQDAAGRVPQDIPEDEIGKVGEQIKQIVGHAKAINGTRETEKAVYLERGRVVDGIFNKLRESLLATKVALEARLGVVQDRMAERKREEARKAAEEKRLREEAEKRERERIAVEAEAEAKRKRDEEAKRQREHDSRMAELKRQEDERKAAAEKRDRELKEAEEAAARKIQEAKDAEEENKRKRNKAIKDAEEAAAKIERDKVAEEKRQREETADIEKKRIAAERDNKREGEAAGREIRQADKVVARTDKDLERAETRVATAVAKEERVENASPAEFARTRGDYGAVVTKVERWIGLNIDRATVDLEALRMHLPMDGLERALNSFIRAGGRKIEGADIVQESNTAVR